MKRRVYAASALLAVLVSLTTLPSWLRSVLSTARAQQTEKHGGDIVFEVKKNKLNLPHALFSHQLHLDRGHTCKDCHNDKVFKRERKLGLNTFTMDEILKGKACGACHDGKTKVKETAVFAPKNNCQRCHFVKLRRAGK